MVREGFIVNRVLLCVVVPALTGGSRMIALGIESTADDLGIGLACADGRILANERSTYRPEKGGIHPREAARHHSDQVGFVISKALRSAGVEAQDIGLVAFSQGPGLGPCLRTGATVARALSMFLEVPLVGVNHSVAHVEIARLSSHATDPLVLFVSGGNTIVTGYESGRYRIYGETLDIPVGNCLDVFAREAGLEYPGGPQLEEEALKGRLFIPMPYLVKGMNLSFSGLLTSAIEKKESGRYEMQDLCFSIQEVAFSMIGEVTERALAHTKKPDLLLTGGVAANKRLQAIMASIAHEHGATCHVVPLAYALDNGPMIAWAGLLAYSAGLSISIDESGIRPRWRLDEVEVKWMK